MIKLIINTNKKQKEILKNFFLFFVVLCGMLFDIQSRATGNIFILGPASSSLNSKINNKSVNLNLNNNKSQSVVKTQANSQNLTGFSQSSQLKLRAQASGCYVYAANIGSQIGAPPPNSTINISSFDIAPINSFSSPLINLTATSSGTTLISNASISPTPITAQVIKTITGFDYIVSNMSCTTNTFVTSIQSTPTGTGGLLVSTLSGYPDILQSSYNANYLDQGTYICFNGSSYFYCEVWEVDLNLNFDFLLNPIITDSGNYNLDMSSISFTGK